MPGSNVYNFDCRLSAARLLRHKAVDKRSAMNATAKAFYDSIERLLPEEVLDAQHSSADAFVLLTRQPDLEPVFRALLNQVLLLMLSSAIRSENAAHFSASLAALLSDSSYARFTTNSFVLFLLDRSQVIIRVLNAGSYDTLNVARFGSDEIHAIAQHISAVLFFDETILGLIPLLSKFHVDLSRIQHYVLLFPQLKPLVGHIDKVRMLQENTQLWGLLTAGPPQNAKCHILRTLASSVAELVNSFRAIITVMGHRWQEQGGDLDDLTQRLDSVYQQKQGNNVLEPKDDQPMPWVLDPVGHADLIHQGRVVNIRLSEHLRFISAGLPVWNPTRRYYEDDNDDQIRKMDVYGEVFFPNERDEDYEANSRLAYSVLEDRDHVRRYELFNADGLPLDEQVTSVKFVLSRFLWAEDLYPAVLRLEKLSLALTGTSLVLLPFKHLSVLLTTSNHSLWLVDRVRDIHRFVYVPAQRRATIPVHPDIAACQGDMRALCEVAWDLRGTVEDDSIKLLQTRYSSPEVDIPGELRLRHVFHFMLHIEEWGAQSVCIHFADALVNSLLRTTSPSFDVTHELLTLASQNRQVVEQQLSDMLQEASRLREQHAQLFGIARLKDEL